MRVFSPANEYTVLTRFRDGRHFTAYNREGKLCLIIVEKKTQEARRLTPILQNWAEIEEFTDFYEFFPYKGGVAVVFACHAGGQTLDRGLINMPYLQRADCLRAVFALILRQNLPSEILGGVMYPENLLILPSGRAELMYTLSRNGASALRHTARNICGECSAPEIDKLYVKIEDKTFSDYSMLYESAGLAADKLACYSPQNPPEKLTLSSMKERALLAAPKISARFTAALALIAILSGYIAAGVLFYRTVIVPPRVDNGIYAIGSVVTEDG